MKQIAKKEQTESKSKYNVKKEICGWIRSLSIAVLITVIINNCVVFGGYVPTPSMENTIEVKNRIFISRLSYLFDEPQRGDVVTFRFPDDESKRFVKRIIGMPNETIQGINGRIYINNSEIPLDEDYIRESMFSDFGPYTIPSDCYFMMGDNRNNSLDSRFWVHKFVERNKIEGKVIMTYFPKFKIIK